MDSEEIITAAASTEAHPALPAPVESDPAALSEDLALAVLQRRDLAPEIVRDIGKHAGLMKARKVRLAVAAHPRAERGVVLRLMREFYTGDLARFALLPAVAADLKHAATELLLTRLPSITLGERISLARRAPATGSAALLLDKESRVWQAALENPVLTEAAVVKALRRPGASEALVAFLCRHAKWSVRPEIRAALLLNEKTPLAQALVFARSLPPAQVRDILHVSRLPATVKAYLGRSVF